MPFLSKLVNDPDTRAGRIFEFTTQFLIVASLVAISIDTLPEDELSESVQLGLGIFELISVVIFSIEYVLRVVTTRRPQKFIFSFFGVIDLLSILPFYIALFSGADVLDLRSLRAFRLLRLFRVLKLVRYSSAIARFKRAFMSAREELILYFSVTLLLLYFAALGIYQFEHKAQPEAFSSIFSSLWWAVATLTTVGYGDSYPITTGGRIFTFVILMIGLGLVSVPAGLIAAALENARHFEHSEEKRAEEAATEKKAEEEAEKPTRDSASSSGNPDNSTSPA
jgi:voltage-gated potassium channel